MFKRIFWFITGILTAYHFQDEVIHFIENIKTFADEYDIVRIIKSTFN